MDDDKLFRLAVASLNYQALFGAVAFLGLIFTATQWSNKVALVLALIGCACVVGSHFLSNRVALTPYVDPPMKPEKMLNISFALWLASIGCAIGSTLNLI